MGSTMSSEMTREQFKNGLRGIESINEIIEKLSELGIDTLGCEEILFAEDIFIGWVADTFGEDGADIVEYWLYAGDENKTVKLDGRVVNVEDIDDLYSYLETNLRK